MIKSKSGMVKFLIGIFFLMILLGFVYIDHVKCFYWAITSDTHCTTIPDTERISFYSDSLKIIGDHFNSGKENSPAAILLHGSHESGRKAALIQLLGKKYSEAGFTVFAIDFRGYGESDDPEFLTAENFKFSNDVVSAINYIINNGDKYNIDTNKLYLIGHSFGAGVALSFLNNNSNVKKMILLGPPRRLDERFLNEQANEKEEFLERWKNDMRLQYELEYSIWSEVYRPLDISNYIPDINNKKHIPIFLIDGENEDKNDLDFLKKISEQISHPVEYWTVPESDHYLNVKYQKDELVYSGKAVKNFIERTVLWLKQ